MSNPGPKFADVAGVKTATETGSGTSTNVSILYYVALLIIQTEPIFAIGAKQFYFNRFAAKCNPMNRGFHKQALLALTKRS